MNDVVLERSHLETLPSADLIALADDLGIDIPEDLNRRFIIGELLEVASEINREQQPDLKDESDEKNAQKDGFVLPVTYNETQISILLRNPVWAFVFWDIREADLLKIEQNAGALSLRVLFFDDENEKKKVDSFEISISLTDRSQYVLLSTEEKVVRVDLVVCFEDGTTDVLASSEKKILPRMPERLLKPLPEMRLSPVLKLSGINELLQTHYMNHRQSFS